MLLLVYIFIKSLQDGRQLPLVWNQSNVYPIFKAGDQIDLPTTDWLIIHCAFTESYNV